MKYSKTLLPLLALIPGLVALAWMVSRIGGDPVTPGLSNKAYFFDLNTGELFVGDANQVPPIEAPSGPLKGTDDQKAGVRAYVFSCGKDSGDNRFIGWLETRTQDAQQTPSGSNVSTGHPLAQQGYGADYLVAIVDDITPDEIKWVSVNTPVGAKIVRRSAEPCPDGSAPVPCIPD